MFANVDILFLLEQEEAEVEVEMEVGWEEVCFLELVFLCLPFVGLLLVGRSVANMLTDGLDRGHRLFLCLRSSKLLAQRPWR